MADRDQYRGYGSPSGRYYENREYDTSYSDRNRDRFSGSRDDRWTSRDDWRGHGDDNRGFFERAGDEIRSWFSDDDYRDRDRYRERDYNDRLRSHGDASGRYNRERDYSRDAREPWGGGDYAKYGARSGRFDNRSAYGSAGYGRDRFTSSGNTNSYGQDEGYGSWRQNQIDALDRDYDDYRRENRDRFHNEFTTWRGQRQKQRTSLLDVREHMDVVGSDGEHVGTVDKVTGDRIVLTKSDAGAGGHHHSIPCGWIQTVDDKVTINKTAEQARNQWRDEENRRALFESEDNRRDDGPHILDRSFSGTYNYR